MNSNSHRKQSEMEVVACICSAKTLNREMPCLLHPKDFQLHCLWDVVVRSVGSGAMNQRCVFSMAVVFDMVLCQGFATSCKRNMKSVHSCLVATIGAHSMAELSLGGW
eukprot:3336961-Amphidinium_carterae.2